MLHFESDLNLSEGNAQSFDRKLNPKLISYVQRTSASKEKKQCKVQKNFIGKVLQKQAEDQSIISSIVQKNRSISPMNTYRRLFAKLETISGNANIMEEYSSIQKGMILRSNRAIKESKNRRKVQSQVVRRIQSPTKIIESNQGDNQGARTPSTRNIPDAHKQLKILTQKFRFYA